MPDLAARIRARLASFDSQDPASDDWGDHYDDFEQTRAALLAVLDTKPPCPTVTAIAAALGIEATT